MVGARARHRKIHCDVIMKKLATSIFAVLLLSACKPAVGSKAWCEDMEAKPKGDWTANEAADYLQHCVIRSDR